MAHIERLQPLLLARRHEAEDDVAGGVKGERGRAGKPEALTPVEDGGMEHDVGDEHMRGARKVGEGRRVEGEHGACLNIGAFDDLAPGDDDEVGHDCARDGQKHSDKKSQMI